MSQIQDQQAEQRFWRYDVECFATISADVFEPAYWQGMQAVIGQESGRGTTFFIQHQAHQLVLRHYLRGGLMRHLSKDKYLFQGLARTRSFAEFSILSELSARGFAVPKPAAAQVVRKGVHYTADLLTHKIPHAQDLLRILQSSQTASFYQRLGAFIANFHKQGVYHADLNIQNILMDKQEQFWLIDFDRAELRPVQRSWQDANLQRLKRSFEKEVLRHQISWTESDWQVFLKAYQQAD